MARVLFKTAARKEDPKMPPTTAGDDTKESEPEPTARPAAVRRPLVRSTKKTSNKKVQKLRKRKKQRNIPRRHGAVYHRTYHSNNTYRNDNRRDATSTWTIKGNVSSMHGVDNKISGGTFLAGENGHVTNRSASDDDQEYPEDGDPDIDMDDEAGEAPAQDN